MNIIKSLLIVYFLINYSIASKTETKISIGFVYCELDELKRAEEIISDLNNEVISINSKSKIKFDFKSLKLSKNDNTISLSLSVCQNLINQTPVYAIVIGKTSCLSKYDDNESIRTVSAISFTSGYYQIPVIDLYNRDSTFSDKGIYSSFIRMSPPYFHQALLWIELLDQFEWKMINLIRSSENEGKMLAARLQYLADHHEIKIVNEVEYIPGKQNYSDIISKLIQSNSRVFLLQSQLSDAEKILEEAEKNDLLTAGNVWIINEEILLNQNLARTKNGVLITEYVEEVEVLYFALAILKKVYEAFNPYLLKKTASNCAENGLEWEIGKKAYEEIIFNLHEFDGKKLEFDDDGDRVSTKYRIINVNRNELLKVGEIKSNSKNLYLKLNQSKIDWPGNLKQKPDGTKWSSKFKIVIIEEKPFIFKVPKIKNKQCNQIVNNSYDCPWSYQNNSQEYCCYGYCIDLIKKISDELNFEYDLYLVPDSLYGDLDSVKGWNGLMGELISDRADMILAPFTINPERAQYVEFTKPFKYQGITILVKRKGSDSSLVSFLQPFKDGLWVIILLSVHVVAVVLYLLDRFSPFGRFKLSKTENTEEDALNLSRALWFTWGVLLNSGIGEGTPRSFSARVLGMVWAGFTMIMVASYTANLAAFLVLDRPEASITGINDARLRNPSDNFSYASVKGSAVERYFKRQVELSTMYRTMENKNYNTAEEAIEDLRNDKIQAFIWDSARLEYEARKSCDFITTGELFGRSSYAFALKKGNPWLHKISLNILTLHENGFIEDLDKEWILLNNTSCAARDSSPSTLGLNNMAGTNRSISIYNYYKKFPNRVFMLVAGGIIVGIFLIFIEIAYKKRKDKKVRQHDISRNAFATWRKNVEKRKLRNTRDSIDHTGKLNSEIKNFTNRKYNINLKTSTLINENENNRLKPIPKLVLNTKKMNLNYMKNNEFEQIQKNLKIPSNRKLLKTNRIND